MRPHSKQRRLTPTILSLISDNARLQMTEADAKMAQANLVLQQVADVRERYRAVKQQAADSERRAQEAERRIADAEARAQDAARRAQEVRTGVGGGGGTRPCMRGTAWVIPAGRSTSDRCGLSHRACMFLHRWRKEELSAEPALPFLTL